MKKSVRTLIDKRIKYATYLPLVGISAGILLGLFMLGAPTASAAACTAPATDYGRATTSVNVSSTATYRIWSRIMAQDASNNSYLLEIDGNNCFKVGDNNMTPGAWTWVDYQNANPASKIQLNLSAGNHSIKMIGQEPGVKLGRMLFVSNLNCVPIGNGDNCATAVEDKEAPTVKISAPAANATVKDIVMVTADVKDNVGVARVEFYINGVLKSTVTAAPYTYRWDTKVTANGRLNLMVKAYDGNGNVNSDSIQVTVAGGDSQAPSVPTNVTARADPASNKVTVKWAASTDNVGVAGYRIIRNKVSTGQTEAITYEDSGVLPDTTYAYQISAFDSAGNSSALSSPVQIKTPNRADSEAPSAPTNLKAAAANTGQVNLFWTPSTDNIAVATYDIFRATGKAAPVRIASALTTSFGDTGLAEQTKYIYYVVARDKAGNSSAKSTVATIETPKVQVKYGALRGRVTFGKNADNHAHVVIRVKGVKQVYDTDQKGNYVIGNLPQTTYKVMYEAQGSYPKEVSVEIITGKTAVQDVILLKR